PPVVTAKELPTGDDALVPLTPTPTPAPPTPTTPTPTPTPPTPTPTPPTPADPDPDHDGIAANDACPNAAETVNGFEDEDGCPDAVPAAISDAFEGARAVRFEPKRVRVGDAAIAALAPALEVLRTHPRLHVDVIAHAGAD